MADYSNILARAVAGKKTPEERRAVYDKARNALITQLRALDPPLPEADITRQRLALEESIRKVEESVGGSAPPEAPTPVEAMPEPMMAPPAPPPPAATPVPAPTLPAASPAPAPPPPSPAPTTDALPPAAIPPALDAVRLSDAPPEAPADGGDPALARVRALPATAPERPTTNRRPLLFAVILVLLLGAIGGAVYALWPMGEGPTASSPRGTAESTPPKITERAPSDAPQPAPNGGEQGQTQGQGQQGQASDPAATPTAQAAFLYEENADNPRGAEDFRGTARWRIDTEAGPQGPERLIRGMIEIPDRGLKVLITIRRNLDRALPASHTVELLFDTVPNFVHGAVENVAGLRMKPSEQANGLPLVGASARITAGYFLIGLSALGPDRERNIVLLRDRPWMDLPLLYRNGRRAVLAIEKGPSGERVFQEVFQSWGG